MHFVEIYLCMLNAQRLSLQVAQYINLSDAMLKGFLEKYHKEEMEELQQLKIR